MSAVFSNQLAEDLAAGRIIPYLGPGVLGLGPNSAVPSSPEALVELITAKVTVPHKIRKNLTAASQYVENFKHRKTLVSLLQEAFRSPPEPNVLHVFLANLPNPLPLIVDVWYDASMAAALASRTDFGQVQGVSRAEHLGEWVHYFRADGTKAEPEEAAGWATLLYKPLGSISPASNFIISDSDYVEVLTEIDIQTPIPDRVKEIRTGRGFLFLGCHFRNQLERNYARQIMKRSGGQHFAVLEGELTRNEARFLKEQGIERIDMPLAEFVAELTGTPLESRRAVA
ncbi:SIR2 family NAD-dependent protein deacylase [Methylocaldum szegediense]|uniref:SIR2-like protein n=1 Tax=Methylocaldum szegediense TaxID=73780 RepID=A0ABM9I8T8_9GAMM|nr:SIR2 family protein [Methylocaldum szegediense]CAI8962990.1 SIR2-like protein [Methylocaldum szegediense]